MAELNFLTRQCEPVLPADILTPVALTLHHASITDASKAATMIKVPR